MKARGDAQEGQGALPVGGVILGVDAVQRLGAKALGLHLGHEFGQRAGHGGDRLARVVAGHRAGDQMRQFQLPRQGGRGGWKAAFAADLGQQPQARQQHRPRLVEGGLDRPQRVAGIAVDRDAGQRLGRKVAHAVQKAAHDLAREIDAGRQREKALHFGHAASLSIASASGMQSGRPTSHQPPGWIRP